MPAEQNFHNRKKSSCNPLMETLLMKGLRPSSSVKLGNLRSKIAFASVLLRSAVLERNKVSILLYKIQNYFEFILDYQSKVFCPDTLPMRGRKSFGVFVNLLRLLVLIMFNKALLIIVVQLTKLFCSLCYQQIIGMKIIG